MFNFKYESIINIVLTAPELLLYKSEYTGSEHHTGEFYAGKIKETIFECEKHRCYVVCTDNTSAMKNSWSLLKNDKELANLSIAYYAYAAQSEILLANDIINQPTCGIIKQKVLTIITTVNGSQVLKERLKEIRREIYNRVIALQLPVKIR